MFNKIKNAIKVRREVKRAQSIIEDMKKRALEVQGANTDFLIKHIEQEEQAVERIMKAAKEKYQIFGISLV